MSLLPEERRRDKSLDAIQKAGAAIVQDGKVLVVRNKTQTSPEYFMAGGKMEGDETQRETLVRELMEELGVDIKLMEYLGSYNDIDMLGAGPIVIHAYYVEIDEAKNIEPRGEIKEYAWVDKDFEEKGIPLGSIMARKVIPELVRRSLM